MIDLLGEDRLDVASTEDQELAQAVFSAARTQRSANAFALGERTGVMMASMPIEESTAPNDEVRLVLGAADEEAETTTLPFDTRYPASSVLRRCAGGPSEGSP